MKRLDYETKKSFSVVVTATDPTGLSDTINIAIEVDDVAEAPDITAGEPGKRAPAFPFASDTRTVAENTSAGRSIGVPVAATDPDNDRLTYSLSGTDAGSFRINSGTGQLTTSAALDYETKKTYSVTVTAKDPGGLTDTIAVTIGVTDVDEGAPGQTLMDRYDKNPQNGQIDREEVIEGIKDYFKDTPLATRDDVVELIRLYLSRQS